MIAADQWVHCLDSEKQTTCHHPLSLLQATPCCYSHKTYTYCVLTSTQHSLLPIMGSSGSSLFYSILTTSDVYYLSQDPHLSRPGNQQRYSETWQNSDYPLLTKMPHVHICAMLFVSLPMTKNPPSLQKGSRGLPRALSVRYQFSQERSPSTPTRSHRASQ